MHIVWSCMHIVWSCMHVLVAIDMGTAIFYVAPAKPFLLPSSMADRFQKLSWRHWHVPTFSMFLLPSHFFHLATENINMAVGTTLWMARMKATPQRWWNVNVKEGEILNNVSNNVTSLDLSISRFHMRKHLYILASPSVVYDTLPPAASLGSLSEPDFQASPKPLE